MRVGMAMIETIAMPSNDDNLEHYLFNIVETFAPTKIKCPVPLGTISFAFSGLSILRCGIIGNLGDLPGFHGSFANSSRSRF